MQLLHASFFFFKCLMPFFIKCCFLQAMQRHFTFLLFTFIVRNSQLPPDNYIHYLFILWLFTLHVWPTGKSLSMFFSLVISHYFLFLGPNRHLLPIYISFYKAEWTRLWHCIRSPEWSLLATTLMQQSHPKISAAFFRLSLWHSL